MKKGADELLEMLNQGLLIVKTNGEYDRIYQKWLAIEGPELRYKRYLLTAIPITLGLVLVASLVLWGRRSITQRRIEAMEAHTARLEHEIRERKLAEQALRESEQSYRRQFEDNAAVMLLIDPTDGRIIDANTAAQVFYGYSRDRLQQMYISEINTLSTLDLKKHMDMITPEHGHRFKFQHRLADGSIRDVDVSVSQIQFGDRKLLSSIIYDLTAKSLFRAILSNLPCMISSGWRHRFHGFGLFAGRSYMTSPSARASRMHCEIVKSACREYYKEASSDIGIGTLKRAR